MSFPSRVYLTGFMASGKSTVGPALASRLGYAFIDLDRVIEEQAGRSIPSIFSDEGEASFRMREREALASTIHLERTVIATGGGALTREEAMSLASANGTVVFLDASPETILNRVAGRSTRRPLLESADEPPEVVVRRLLQERRPYYARADIQVGVDGRSVSDIVAEIMHRAAE